MSAKPTPATATATSSAAEWDIEQHVRMSPQERMRAARALKDRVYPPDAEDVRACHKTE